MVDFNDVLNKPAAEIEKPPIRPAGTYLASITAMPEVLTRNTKDGERQILSFKAKLVAPKDDVSQDAMSAQPEISTWPPMNYDIWLSDDLFPLKRFLNEVLGIEVGDKTIKEMLADVPGRTFLATIEHKPYTDKSTGQPSLAANITKTAAA